MLLAMTGQLISRVSYPIVAGVYHGQPHANHGMVIGPIYLENRTLGFVPASSLAVGSVGEFKEGNPTWEEEKTLVLVYGIPHKDSDVSLPLKQDYPPEQCRAKLLTIFNAKLFSVNPQFHRNLVSVTYG